MHYIIIHTTTAQHFHALNNIVFLQMQFKHSFLFKNLKIFSKHGAVNPNRLNPSSLIFKHLAIV